MRYLVLGPASMGYYAMLGTLKTLESHFHTVEEISGASAGAMIALFIALGLPIDTMLESSLCIDVSAFVKFNLGCFIQKYGFVEIEPIREKLRQLCGCDPTFDELETKVHIAAYCLNTAETQYFSKDTHPHMKVIDAVCMSIAIPFIFCAQIHNGLTYIDGGTAESYPLGPFLDKKYDQVTCISLSCQKVYHFDFKNPKQYLESIIRTMLSNRMEYKTQARVIKIDIGDINVFDFNMSYEDKVRMYLMGVHQKI